MNTKIFLAIWSVAVTVFLASLIFIMGISYNYFSELQKKQLKNETELAAQGVAISGESYFKDLNAENYRITWIGADGCVIYDNEADSVNMGNHLEREEVVEAQRFGYGEAVRYSNTLAHKQLYAAKRLPDGSVLRLSIVQVAVWTLLWGFARPISLVVLIALFASFFLASRLAKKIVKPLNEIDIEHTEQYYGKDNYREVEPLLRQIAAQRSQLIKDQAQIEKTSLIRQEFTANVSHELKTPLHTISGYAELLENGLVQKEDVKPFAGKIRGESMRMARLVEDIIDLTELDSGGSELKWEKCDLSRIAENAVDSLEAAAAALGVKLERQMLEAPLTAVPQLLYSIVYNLCDNAVKYNHAGGSVTVSVRPEGYRTVLSVKDTGIGIPEECKDRIFERFYRVDKSRSKETGGTGLGLSIVKHAAVIHKAKIVVKSDIGKGSEFLVFIPNEPDR